METINSTGNTKAWILCAISMAAMAVFATLFFLKDEPSLGVKTVTNTITNEVIKEIPKEVEKLVPVPAEIPPEYQHAMRLFQKMTNAEYASQADLLFNLKGVKAVCSVDENLKSIISADEVKAKFELTLRRNNVPIDPSSTFTLCFNIYGFFSSESLICYAIECSALENQLIFREGDCKAALVPVWQKGNSFGTVGKTKASESLVPLAEKCAEIFANDFLSANTKHPKKDGN